MQFATSYLINEDPPSEIARSRPIKSLSNVQVPSCWLVAIYARITRSIRDPLLSHASRRVLEISWYSQVSNRSRSIHDSPKASLKRSLRPFVVSARLRRPTRCRGVNCEAGHEDFSDDASPSSIWLHSSSIRSPRTNNNDSPTRFLIQEVVHAFLFYVADRQLPVESRTPKDSTLRTFVRALRTKENGEL